jgi:hypothetical protein
MTDQQPIGIQRPRGIVVNRRAEEDAEAAEIADRLSTIHVALLRTLTGAREEIREAADQGDYLKVRDWLRRLHDAEVDLFAVNYVIARHQRKRQRVHGANPDLERLEKQLSAILTRLGQPAPYDQRAWLG